MSFSFALGPVELGLAALVLVGVLLSSTTSARALQRRAQGFAKRSGLPEVTPELVRRVGRRWRFVVTGTVLGLVATGPLDLFLVPVYAGLALGAVTDALTRPGPPPGTPRVAHATSRRLRDYVPGWVLGTAVAAAATAPLLALLWAVAPRRPGAGPRDLTGPEVGWLLLATAVGLAASLGLARLVVGRRQPAGTADELAVDDALRAQAVRDVLQVTAVATFAAGWVLSLGLTEPAVEGVTRRIGGAFPLVLLLGIAVVGTVHEFTGGPKHWRSRLAPAR